MTNGKKMGFFAMLLALLGIVPGCWPPFIAMYGAPDVDFTVKGKVTDESGKPIPGISVSLSEVFGTDEGFKPFNLLDSVKTDENGAYIIYGGGYIKEIQVKAEDVDGPLNGGEFAADSTHLTVDVYSYPLKDNGFYWGAYDVNLDIPTINLKKK